MPVARSSKALGYELLEVKLMREPIDYVLASCCALKQDPMLQLLGNPIKSHEELFVLVANQCSHL